MNCTDTVAVHISFRQLVGLGDVCKIVFLLCCVALLPGTTHAAVTINEIAWMGTSVSPNHEWIELYNDSTNSVSVDGWMLQDTDSLNINLTGTIPAGGYAVLERTSDASAPGSAFLVYTGALKNTGTTLTLRRSDNSIADQVAGGEDWQNVGGDNTTKATAQYTTTGWLTAQPTPGAVNVTTVTPDLDTDTSADESPSSARLAEPVAREPLTLSLPEVTLQLTVAAPRQAYVNQAIDFAVEPSGVGKTIANSLQYEWNFGDLTTSKRKDPQHSFQFPGTYVVHVSAAFGRQVAYATHEITVLPVALSLTQNQAGDIQINNDARYQIDLSNFRLRAAEAVVIPDNTWLLPQQTITVPTHAVGDTHNQLIALYDELGNLIASVLPPTLTRTSAIARAPSPAAPLAVTPVASPPVPNFGFAEAITPTEPVAPRATGTADNNASMMPTAPPTTQFHWTWLALAALLTVSTVVVLVQPFLKTASDHNV
jgi:hypothetical protein